MLKFTNIQASIKLLGLAKNNWRGFSTQIAHMVHIDI